MTDQITIEAFVPTTPQAAFDAYTTPEDIMQWNFASDDWCCPRAENDLRVGGRYVVRMEAKDGSFGFEIESVYDQVVPHEAIAYTMSDGRTVTTTFATAAGSTTVTTTFEAEQQYPAERQRQGWQAILDSFKRHAESA